MLEKMAKIQGTKIEHAEVADVPTSQSLWQLHADFDGGSPPCC